MIISSSHQYDATLWNKGGRKSASPISGDRDIDIAARGGHGFGIRPVARIPGAVALRCVFVIAQMLCRLGIEPAFQTSPEVLSNRPIFIIQLDLTAIDLVHQFIKGPKSFTASIEPNSANLSAIFEASTTS